MSPEAMITSQVHFYDRAVLELLEEINHTFAKRYKEHKMRPKIFKSLHLLDGTRVRNLLDIPQDAKVLLTTDQDTCYGVEFEDVKLTELDK